MGYFGNIKNTIMQGLVRIAPDTMVLVEAALRRDEALTKLIEPESRSVQPQDIQDWKLALMQAMSKENPSRINLYNVYDNVMRDLHLEGIIEDRILAVQCAKFRIVDKDGNTNDDLTDLFKKRWYLQFVEMALMADYYGTTVIEISEIKDGEIKKVKMVPRRHVKPEKGVIVKNQNDTDGWSYREEPYAPYYIEVGEPEDLGMLENISPIALSKRYAMGAWINFARKFGIPFRWVTSPSRDDNRKKQLGTILDKMGDAGWAVLNEEEKLEILSLGQADPHKVFEALKQTLNSEMSKRVLGQDGTTDNKDATGTYGSLKIMERVSAKRHTKDKTNMNFLINDELIPRMVMIGYPLDGYTFEWDEGYDLSVMEYIEAVAKLSPYYEVSTEQITEKTGVEVTGIKSTGISLPSGEQGGDPADPNNPTGKKKVPA